MAMGVTREKKHVASRLASRGMGIGKFARADSENPLEMAGHVALVGERAFIGDRGHVRLALMLADEFLGAVHLQAHEIVVGGMPCGRLELAGKVEWADPGD